MNRKETIRLYTSKNGRFFVLEGTAREMYQKFSTFLRYSLAHNQAINLSLESRSHRIKAIATTKDFAITVMPLEV